jgi:class 3 adenylate cyclase
MFAARRYPRLASMGEIDAVPLNWSDLGVSELVPTGTVTLLLADVEGSTRLWETQPDEMTDAIANLDRTLAQVVDSHHGVRPVEQGEGDSFVVAFGRASDAVGCALSAAGTAGADPVAYRCAHRRGSAARRSQLHRPHDQSNRAAARFGARRADRLIQYHKRFSHRPAPSRCMADRSGHPSGS